MGEQTVGPFGRRGRPGVVRGPGGRPSRGIRVIAAVVAAACTLPGPAAFAEQAGEYEVKAAFLVNFVSFVGWPKRAFSSRDAPVTLCVSGEDPFGPTLDAALEGKNVGGRLLRVRRLAPAEAPAGCHVLFVAASQEKLTDPIVAYARRAAILTVGDYANFARRGGVIEFFVEERRIHFAINADGAVKSGLRISARLLALARVIDPGEGVSR